MTRGAVDERAFAVIRRIREQHKDLNPLPLADFKAMVREQYFMLLIDAAGAVAAIPAMLPADAALRTQAFALIKQVIESPGKVPPEGAKRLKQVERLFSGKHGPARHGPATDGPSSVVDIKGKWPPARRSGAT
jgi:hypothetical protein